MKYIQYGLVLAVLVGVVWIAADRPSIDTLVFRGLADASAIEALDADWIVLADDEDNQLRLYRRDQPGAPIQQTDLRAFLELKQGKQQKSREVDIEGSARIGDHIFWISSHGRNALGKPAPERRRFFCTRVDARDGVPQLVPEGPVITNLLERLEADPRLQHFHLSSAAELAPKAEGGLNIEGLSPTPEGALLLAFRNPVPEGRALLIPLTNPLEILKGSAPRWGDPILLDMGGRGVRSLTYWANAYWILAGSIDGASDVQLFRWKGGDSKPVLTRFRSSSDLRWEGLAGFESQGKSYLWIVSDDGSRLVDGKPAKQLKNPLQRTFRASILRLDGDDPIPLTRIELTNEPFASRALTSYTLH